jgi:hypothetical protein
MGGVDGCRNYALIGQHVQKCPNFCGPHVVRMPHFANAAMPPDEKPHPMQVSLLGAEAIVKVANSLPHLRSIPQILRDTLSTD